MKLMKLSVAAFLIAGMAFTSCKPKDADVQAAVQQKEEQGVTVSVKDGVATLTGTVVDEATKAKAEDVAKGEKGVKSVVNQLELPPPPPPAAVPMVQPGVADMMGAIKDATKDFPTVTASVADGVVTLSGSIKKDKLPRLMMAISALRPKKIENKLTVN